MVQEVRMNLLKSGIIIATAASLLFAEKGGNGNDYRLIYFDGHMHTVESDGTGTIEDIKAAARSRGLDAAIVTNHAKQLTLDEWNDLSERAKALCDSNFLMINAFEVTGSEGMFNRDHVLAWGVRDPFVGEDSLELAPEEIWESPRNPDGAGAVHPANITRWVEYIHENGGIAVHAHTTGNTNPAYGVDYIEVINLSHIKDVAFYAKVMGFSEEDAWDLGLTLNNMAIYGERDLNMMVTMPGVPVPVPLKHALFQATESLTGTGEWLGAPAEPLRSWDQLLAMYVNGEIERPVFGVANSDAHNTYNIEGRTWVGGSGDTQKDRSNDDSDVGELKNGVLVKHLSRPHLMQAIKAGRLFATTGPSLRFTVNGHNMGSTVKLNKSKNEQSALKLSVDSETESGIIAKIDIIKNGSVWRTLSPMAPAYEGTIVDESVPSDGYYRIEIVVVDGWTGEYDFAYTNPVFTRVGSDETGE